MVTFETEPGTVVNVFVAAVATPLTPVSLTVTVYKVLGAKLLNAAEFPVTTTLAVPAMPATVVGVIVTV
jgi:hypothetical protein